MKRIIAGVLSLCLILTLLTGCKKNKYEPVESTEEEARVIATLTFGEESYDIRYELYRALFLTYKSEVDGGDPTVWESERKDEYIAMINERIFSEAASIYAVLHLCGTVGYDLYSEEVEDEIYEMITVSVEGGTWGDSVVEGFGGDYGAYLDSLRKMNHNYETALLLTRYEIGRRLLEEHYIGEASLGNKDGQITEGALKYTTETVRTFYYSEGAAQILMTYIPEEIDYTPRERAERVRAGVIEEAKKGVEAVRAFMINSGTPTATAELESGMVVGEHSLSRDYSALATAALTLGDGEVSEVIETVSAEDGIRYYVVYRMEKSDGYFEENYTAIAQSYLCDAIGGMLARIATEMEESAILTDAYLEIVHSEVSM